VLAQVAVKPARHVELDLFKSVLVTGMVSAHVVQLISADLPSWTLIWADYINLITFSGFLFAFGLGVGFSSSRGNNGPSLSLLRRALLLLLATYLSSIAFLVWVDGRTLRMALLLDVFTLKRLFGWSEFLASFAVLYALLAVGRPLFVWLASHWWSLAAVLTGSALSTLIVNNDNIPALATLVGTERFASFPLLPYAGWFFLGIALGRQGGRLRPWHGLVSIALTGAYFGFLWVTGEGPERFPPAVLWIAGAALPLIVYLAVLGLIASRKQVHTWLLLPGRHALSLVLFSNLMIFYVRWAYQFPVTNTALWFAATLVLVGVPMIAWAMVERAGRRSAVRVAP
jgi:hypothetical protein